ncbi:hypothetical protein [Halomicrobium katesii]|uniref:hypothetical protein n=1 Tax=Halomicrobium katesii TaxID=437163 RepID=UPI000376387E|nr:hypothetical protein [Halomicrobium katesii]
MLEGEPVCVAISMANERNEKAHVVGYSPKSENWVIIESWHEDEWTVPKQEKAIDDWAESAYDEADVDHSFINV